MAPSLKKSRHTSSFDGEGFEFQNKTHYDSRPPRYRTLGSGDISIAPESLADAQDIKSPVTTQSHKGKRVIFAATALIVIPMIGLAALLLGLVLVNRVDQPLSTGENAFTFSPPSMMETHAFYVDFNPTTLVTIASWSSTVAPLLAVGAMILVSFPLAKQLKDNSREDGSLPTPFQLGLLLETLTGGITPLWDITSYCRWPHRHDMSSSVRTALIALAFFTGLGYVPTLFNDLL